MTALAVFRAVWGLLRSPLGQVIALAVVALVALCVADGRGYRRGVSEERARWETKLAADAAKARKIEARNEAVGQKVAAKLDADRVEIRWRTKTLTEKVTEYVPYDPGRPGVPAGLVRLHDAAALMSELPAGPGLTNGAPSAVTDAQLAETVIANYGVCHANSQQLAAFQDWARATGLAK